MSFEDEVLRTEREMNRHHDAREDLSEAISDLGDEVRSYDFDDQSNVTEEFERFARTVGDYLEKDRSELEDDADELEYILGELRDQRHRTYGGWNFWAWGQQQQSMGQGNMYQSQGFRGQNQGIGWQDPWQNQNYVSPQQHSREHRDWFQEFWNQGENDTDPLDISDNTDNSGDEQVTVIDETTEEEEDYTEPEDSGYNEQDIEEQDRSVDRGTTFGPESTFDYSGGQELGGATQNFNFSGSGVSISGSVTMEQSVGDENQYFEASF